MAETLEIQKTTTTTTNIMQFIFAKCETVMQFSVSVY